MNKPSPKALEELRKRWEEMQAIRKSRRTQEEIINELSLLISDFQKGSFLPYLTQMTKQFSIFRKKSPINGENPSRFIALLFSFACQPPPPQVP